MLSEYLGQGKPKIHFTSHTLDFGGEVENASTHMAFLGGIDGWELPTPLITFLSQKLVHVLLLQVLIGPKAPREISSSSLTPPFGKHSIPRITRVRNVNSTNKTKKKHDHSSLLCYSNGPPDQIIPITPS